MAMEIRHYLAFQLKNCEQRFVYVVTEETKKDVTEVLRAGVWGDFGSPVIKFEDAEGRIVAVNAEYIRLCQAMYDAGVYAEKSEEDIKPDLIVAVDGLSKPLVYNDIDPDDAGLAGAIFADCDLQPDSFFLIIDEDGEENLIPAGSIMLMESLHYEDEIAAEIAELEKQSKKAKPKAVRAKK